MADDRRCQRCGEAIPADAPEGLCPGCLLRAGLDEAAPPPDRDRRPHSPEEMGRLIPPPPPSGPRSRRRTS